MYLTVKQQLNHLSKNDYLNIRELSHIAKNLANEAIYNARQYFFEYGGNIGYQENYKLLKNSENYKILNSNMSQQILKDIDESFRSFLSLLKLANNGQYSYDKIQLPHYHKKDGFSTLIIGFVRLKGNKLVVPYSRLYAKKHGHIEITVPPNVVDKHIKEIRIIPKCHGRFFEVQYTYEVDEKQIELDKTKALSVDLGINNLASCVTNNGETFIIDGRRLKSINQLYNKTNARLQSIKDKQKIDKPTSRQLKLANKRNNRVNDYMSKTAKMIINYCIEHDIGNLVIGMNDDFQRSSNIGKRNNQTFVNIPFGKLVDKLEYLCQLNSISFIKQEESYTSKASFFDEDEIPIYDKTNLTNYRFSGKRIRRGLYKTRENKILNADINGALNILRKSKVVDLEVLYNRGEVDTPVRIRIA